MKKLSIVLATRNEEANIAACLDSIKSIADEVIVVDEESTDKTREIAKTFGAKVITTTHEPIFHKTKQKALDMASGDWILQLDADERSTPQLNQEIRDVIEMTDQEIMSRRPKEKSKWRLFKRHMDIIEARDGVLGKPTGEVVAFFLPRVNYFLGKPLIHAGVYPDPAIRLIKKGKAWFPAKDVHEIMQFDGEVAWLFNDEEHHDSPTLRRYLMRLNRYTDLHAMSLRDGRVAKNPWQFFNYSLIKPVITFFRLFIRHKGFADGLYGFMWSAFSASHFPIAYYKYLTIK